MKEANKFSILFLADVMLIKENFFQNTNIIIKWAAC